MSDDKPVIATEEKTEAPVPTPAVPATPAKKITTATTVAKRTPVVQKTVVKKSAAKSFAKKEPATKKVTAAKKPTAKATTAKAAASKAVVVTDSKKNSKKGKKSNVADVELSNKDYEKELKKLHVELVKLQLWVQHKGLKVAIVFEGRDGAGKGGTIKALTERVSPRVFRVVALPAPSEREKTQMYLQRYIKHFPAAGEVVIFDRSWYNRAGVERVMGFCTEQQSQKFLGSVPIVERSMIESGIILLKYWLEVSPEEQERRLGDRIDDGRKVWKLTPMDLKSFDRWDDYTRARDAMFQATDTSWAPWYVARSESKKRVRLNIIKHLLNHVPYEELPAPKIKLPKRKIGRYKSVDYPFRMVPEKY
jgi:polyphosphate kinase 2